MTTTNDGQHQQPQHETIALFGATGRTGREFLKLALDAGYNVSALARDPSKIDALLGEGTAQHRLTVVQGDVQDSVAIRQVVHGAVYVVCMLAAGGTAGAGNGYPQDFMLGFVQRLYAILEDQTDHGNDTTTTTVSSTKVLLYQAGSMSSDGAGFLHPVAWLMKQTLGRKLGIFPKINDNNAAIRFIANQKRDGLRFIVTRAGVLQSTNDGTNDGATKDDKAVASSWVSISFECIDDGGGDIRAVALAVPHYSYCAFYTAG